MYFVGLDLAWGQHKPSGVAVVDDDGGLVHVETVSDDDGIRAALGPYVHDGCLVAIDAPLIVTNTTGHRPAETALNADFGRFQAAARPSNTDNVGPPRAAAIAESLDLDIDPASTSQRRAIEVSLHPATVALFRLDRTLKYKAKPGRDATRRRSEMLRLMDLIEGLCDADPPLRVNDSAAWHTLRARAENATRKSEVRRVEDPVEAVLCAYIARFVHAKPDQVTVYGDGQTGYIVTPKLPPTPAVRSSVAAYAQRRPALISSTAHYLELVTALIDDAGIDYLSATARTKTVESFAAKAERLVDGRHLFADPLTEVTDQIGLRVITYLRDDVDAVATLLTDAMRLLDDRDMGRETASAGRWGYASRHLLVAVEGEQQPASIQIRTVLQHAWAEFEHDIRYKGSVPDGDAPDLDRRFTLAAGLLELADREFSAIRDRLRSAAPSEVLDSPPDQRIATPVLATYLANRFPDAGWSRTDHYWWISGLLLELGIDTLDDLDRILHSIDTDATNAVMDYRFPPGAVRRLDDALLALYGQRYIALQDNSHRISQLQTRAAKLG